MGEWAASKWIISWENIDKSNGLERLLLIQLQFFLLHENQRSCGEINKLCNPLTVCNLQNLRFSHDDESSNLEKLVYFDSKRDFDVCLVCLKASVLQRFLSSSNNFLLNPTDTKFTQWLNKSPRMCVQGLFAFSHSREFVIWTEPDAAVTSIKCLMLEEARRISRP